MLASTSPARLALLRAAGVRCEGRAPGVDEDRLSHADPARLAELRATAKAEAIAAPGAIVIGADQVAHLDGAAFGKPLDPADHRARLRQLRGRTHTLSTAVSLVYGAERRHLVRHTRLHFRAEVSDAEIDAYVATGEGSGCAGGYAAEGMGAQLIEWIDGDYFNVLGLPLLDVLGQLRAMGWRPDFRGNPS